MKISGFPTNAVLIKFQGLSLSLCPFIKEVVSNDLCVSFTFRIGEKHEHTSLYPPKSTFVSENVNHVASVIVPENIFTILREYKGSEWERESQ